MVNLALKSSNWIQLSTWESDNTKWTPTLDVLNYHKADLISSYGSDLQLMFLCGGDLVETFSIPGVWQTDHVCLFLCSFKTRLKFD
jgi:nicotinamide mononucleotide adenylyltransferase